MADLEAERGRLQQECKRLQMRVGKLEVQLRGAYTGLAGPRALRASQQQQLAQPASGGLEAQATSRVPEAAEAGPGVRASQFLESTDGELTAVCWFR